ncbi:DNA polymerase III subunit beta [Candidatus Shapirobacteria bacterium]|nr:DNA polymerase III subunit beta [Candidatus Shapirobacteria bacterium]
MKLTLLQENLSSALNTVFRFLPARPTLPVLGNILLATEKNRLKISATNLEMGINYFVGAKIENEGKTTVLARPFLEFVNSLPPAGKVDLFLKKEGLEVACGGFQALFPIMPAEEFPQISTISSSKISFKTTALNQAIRETIFAATNDESRPVLGGVQFKIRGKECQLAATDGYRLSLKRVVFASSFGEQSFIVPANALAEVSRVKTDQEEVEMGLSNEEKQAVFFLPNIELSSRLLEGSFPNIEEVIPKEGKTKVVLEKEDFRRAIKMAAIFARESANIVKLEAKENELVITANSPQVGENKSRLEAQVAGPKQKIAFNFRFLLDLVEASEEESLAITLNDSLSPALFYFPKSDSFSHVIMPVRLQEE